MIQTKENNPRQLTREDLKKIREYFLTNVKRKAEGQNGKSSISTEMIEKFLEEINEQVNIKLGGKLKATIFKEVLNEVQGYGPIQPLLNDPSITEVMVNGPKKVYIEKAVREREGKNEFKNLS